MVKFYPVKAVEASIADCLDWHSDISLLRIIFSIPGIVQFSLKRGKSILLKKLNLPSLMILIEILSDYKLD